MLRTRLMHATAVAALLFVSVPALAQRTESVDTAAVAKIRAEAFERSNVMEIASYLTDVHGPRLTGSPYARAAADWTVETMKSWGITNPRLETWGPFGRGWVVDRFSAQVLSPTAYPLIAYMAAWSEGTNGPQVGEVVYARVDSEPDFARLRGTLRGKWLLTGPVPTVQLHWEARARRFTDEQLREMEAAAPLVAQVGGGRGRGGGPGRAGGPPNFAAMQQFQRRVSEFYMEEGALGIIRAGTGRGDAGTVVAGSAGSRQVGAPRTLPTVSVAAEHWGRMYRTAARGIPVQLEIDARVRFFEEDQSSFNILGEIPGTDRRLRDEVVMLGAHFDSWHGGTGATDNAAGSAAMLEALRILKALNLPMRRTVRIALWTGEEQGLLGSRAYVRQHFGYRDTTGNHFTRAHGRVSGYFNMDNGTGAIRGVYLQGNEAVRPIFDAWLRPFHDLGTSTLTIRNTASTDHVAFDAVGIPGFQFIQDPIEYSTRTHHSNMDLYDRLQENDLMQNAAIIAAFVYHTANRPELLPRKP